MNSKFKFKSVTKQNWEQINLLSAGKENVDYIPNTSHILLDAIFNNKLKYVKAIYYKNKPIGLFYAYPKGNDAIFIARFMIDYHYQNKGLGNAVFPLIIEQIHTSIKQQIYISTKNPIALKLYKKHGFIERDDSEAKKYYKKFNEIHLIKELKN